MRWLFVLLIPFSLLGQEQLNDSLRPRYIAQAKKVSIIRDNWGVPHIYGKTDADAVFGLLYAQCEENFPRIERNYLEMLGRLSEVEGMPYVFPDLRMRLIYDSSEAKADYRKTAPWLKKLLVAFADGINYYLATHPEVKPRVLHHFEPWFPLMFTDGSISATQDGGLTLQDIQNLYGREGLNSIGVKLGRPGFADEEPAGSNGFAVGPSRTQSKHAILYINPHVTFYFRSEVHMVSEEGLNVYGAVTWGQFFVYQGFNQHCGWMHTSSYADVADLYIEKTVKKGKEVYYQYDHSWLKAKNKKIIIAFKSAQALQQQSFTTYSTLHGPVMGSRDGSWLSLKQNNRSLKALIQSWLRTKASGFKAFREVMQLRSNNSNNTVFADDKGNIAYWHGNFMPKRDQRYNWTLPVDGSVSATGWKGIHPLQEMIHLYNPSSGWIQNCNSTPFTAAGLSSPKKENYPNYMAPDGQNPRALTASRLLSQANHLTMDQMIEDIGYNHYLSAFDVLLPPLLQSFQQLKAGEPLQVELSAPIALIANWDKISSSESIATTLGVEWAYKLAEKIPPPATSEQASDLMGQLRAMASLSSLEKLKSLQDCLHDLEKRFGSWKVAWGEVNRYQRSGGDTISFEDSAASLAVGLASAAWGSIPSFVSKRFVHTSRRYGLSGNSFVACVEFGKTVHARSVITGGQFFEKNSKHFSDQAEMYINGKFKEVWFYKEDVLKHAEKKYYPGEGL
ncbi:MAG: penicillin acylase family protein [Flavisolibacter sp.]